MTGTYRYATVLVAKESGKPPNDNIEKGHKAGRTYDFPRGRLMTIPVWEAWEDEDA